MMRKHFIGHFLLMLAYLAPFDAARSQEATQNTITVLHPTQAGSLSITQSGLISALTGTL